MPPEVSVIIPTMNEEESIGEVLMEIGKAFASSPLTYEVIVVDTRSRDRTVAIAEGLGAQVVQEDRRGYGRAYKTGFSKAKGRYIATLDADLSYPGAQVPGLVSRLAEGGADFISCDRLSSLPRGSMDPSHRLGNGLLNLTILLLFRERLRDSQSGMWLFRRDLLGSLRLTSDGMPFSEELKLEVLRAGFNLEEVPIHYRRRVGEAKLNSLRDGWANLRYLLSRRLNPALGASPPSSRA